MTHDHSYVEELVDAGKITADEARVHPNSSVITRALGSDPAMYADHFTQHIEEGDSLILCSDGLSSMISDSDIENIATQYSTAQICTDNLVDAALNAGGPDNVTVVVVDVVDDGLMRDVARLLARNILSPPSGPHRRCDRAGGPTRVSPTPVLLGVPTRAMVAIYADCPASRSWESSLHWLERETSIKLSDFPKTRKTA